MNRLILSVASVLVLLGSAFSVRGAENSWDLMRLKSLGIDEIMQSTIPRQQHTPGFLLANWTIFRRELIKQVEAVTSVYNVFDRKYGSPVGPDQIQGSIPQNGRPSASG